MSLFVQSTNGKSLLKKSQFQNSAIENHVVSLRAKVVSKSEDILQFWKRPSDNVQDVSSAPFHNKFVIIRFFVLILPVTCDLALAKEPNLGQIPCIYKPPFTLISSLPIVALCNVIVTNLS